jgi:hypothetical protein
MKPLSTPVPCVMTKKYAIELGEIAHMMPISFEAQKEEQQ